MRSKDFWRSAAGETSPFDLPRRVLSSLASAFRGHTRRQPASAIKYIWLRLGEGGLHTICESGSRARLDIDGWLNVIDESAALGAEWLVIHVDASLGDCPEVWDISEWAQRSHGIHVGLHLQSAEIGDDELRELNKLDGSLTHVIVDREKLPSFRFLKEKGVQLIEANVSAAERGTYCTNPEAMAYVGSNGTLYSCGLVAGDDAFAFGNAAANRLDAYMKDCTFPHAIPDTGRYPIGGCSGCPPFMAKRLANIQGR